MRPIFSLDTSLFLNGWNFHYPVKTFPGVWDAIDHELAEGRATACREVYDEILKKDDGIAAWVKHRQQYFVPTTEDCLLRLRDVMAAFPNFAAQGGSPNEADPFVIAFAMLTDTTVVTDETPEVRRDTKPPSIPQVCEHFGIAYMKPTDFLTATGQIFR